MELNKINILLDKYYSGEISPDEYVALLSELKEGKGFPMELEAERRMLLEVDSCVPIMPDGLEKRLEEAIDRRQKRAGRILRVFIAGSVAAILLLCVTVGLRYVYNKPLHSELVSQAVVARKTVDPITTKNDVIAPETFEESTAENEEPASIDISDQDLAKAAQIIDDALLNVLSGIQVDTENVNECVESIQISQKTNFNIF